MYVILLQVQISSLPLKYMSLNGKCYNSGVPGGVVQIEGLTQEDSIRALPKLYPSFATFNQAGISAKEPLTMIEALKD